ncbi:MAG: hypothetical protein IJ203_01590 [Atopobiaceae bacterium]|nr:hypothetical protein [Atopobiaceae bacterium]
MMNVTRSSVFPATREEVFARLQRLDTLQRVAWPYATFDPVGEDAGVWEPGATSSYRFRLLGFIPFGTHVIHVVRFGLDEGIYTHEGNEHVPTWNHEIRLEALPGGRCRYTDCVDIDAGLKTPFIWLWAQAFYAHRQRTWVRLLRAGSLQD